MYKVFIENKAVLFISDYSQLPKNKALEIFEPKTYSYLEIRRRRRKVIKEVTLVVKADDEKLAWQRFKFGLKKVTAAGGLVENIKGEYLLIYRNRRWDLPKGKLKKGEKKKNGAIREIEEECGVGLLEIKKKLVTTHHVVNQNKELILKKVHWYQLYCGYVGPLKPQIQEGITKVEWTIKKKAAKRFQNSWGTIRSVMEAANLMKTKEVKIKPSTPKS
ncbi:MAG: 8-oxo-dGTP pyrophosphatase MutT (NUDIX family) [Patiriisocius sp.]|jgi:8-oxo-dGTP pyrophosphatase MutT (NUDIX family)